MLILKNKSLLSSQIVNIRPCTPLGGGGGSADETDDSSQTGRAHAATGRVGQIENYDHLNKTLLACVCMANSTLFSKPNNKQIFTNNIEKLLNKSTKTTSELQMCVVNLFKLAYRDSNWRYSIVGNWLKFQMNKTNDEIKFLKSIKKFSKISNVRGFFFVDNFDNFYFFFIKR